MDTMPTPGLVRYCPQDMFAYRGAGTTHHKESIEGAIRNTAAAAGIQHHFWHNIDSTFMGASLRVIMMAKLILPVSRFTRANMFGCDTFTELPEECRWTLLMYSQEI